MLEAYKPWAGADIAATGGCACNVAANGSARKHKSRQVLSRNSFIGIPRFSRFLEQFHTGLTFLVSLSGHVCIRQTTPTAIASLRKRCFIVILLL
jgi:hypothetical protein